MSWEKNLLPASFRGVAFNVVSTDDYIERATVSHEYPYVDGANVEDMGRSARPISMQAVFFGDDYEAEVKEFLDAVDKPGAGELIHPVFGTFRAQFNRSRIGHIAERPNFATLTLDFTESKLRSPLFDRVLPRQEVDAVNDAADQALNASKSAFAFDFTKVPNLPGLLKERLGADMLNTVDNMRGLADQVLGARTWIASGLSYLNNPASFMDDLSGGLVSRVKGMFSPMDLRLRYGSSGVAGLSPATTAAIAAGVPTAGAAGGTVVRGETGTLETSLAPSARIGYTRGSLAEVWKAPVAHLKQPLLTLEPAPAPMPSGAVLAAYTQSGLTAQLPVVLPVMPSGAFITALTPVWGVETQPFLSTHVTVQQAIAIAGAAAELFALDLDAAVLTPSDIEVVAGDTRAVINYSIALVRATYPDIKQARPITEPLKALALAVSDVAERLIRAKPRLVDRRVDSAGNLPLIAHLWYGDYRRAEELLRLNPGLANPNFVARGESLRAYVA